jgi:hypothetical protein
MSVAVVAFRRLSGVPRIILFSLSQRDLNSISTLCRLVHCSGLSFKHSKLTSIPKTLVSHFTCAILFWAAIQGRASIYLDLESSLDLVKLSEPELFGAIGLDDLIADPVPGMCWEELRGGRGGEQPGRLHHL